MAAGDDLKLLGLWASPFVTRVKLALSFKGLSFKDVEEDLAPPCIDPHERAIARFWAAYVDDKLLVARRQAFRGKTEEEKSEGTKLMFAALETLEGALRECSKGQGYFGGETVGLVDVSLGSLLSWLNASGVNSGIKIFDPIKTPLLAAWVERFSELDGAKAALPDVDRVIEYAKMRKLL
ncbi:unnamed protein product [Alopecurus aequalis]